MSKKIMTCITCPVGCELSVVYEAKKFISATGHKCARGKKYAVDETENPRRVLTSTVAVIGAKIKLMPVKTDRPVKKEKIFEAMAEINKIKIKSPVKTGDIVYPDFTETGINLVAGRDIDS